MKCAMLKTMTAAAAVVGMQVGAALGADDATDRIKADRVMARMISMVSADRLRDTHIALAAEPHVAGSTGDAHVIAKLADAFAKAGLEVQVHDIWPLLCRPVAAELSITSPTFERLELAERKLEEDADSADLSFAWNAYSGSGTVEGGVVYVNYGTKQDFAKLRELGVSCKGKVVLARYGGNYRGYKVKFAEEAGAAGIIIYTDPGDSGFAKGDVYPVGGYANECCIQRGSIITAPFQGDPLTPGREATEHAERDAIAAAPLPRIPCQPIGYGSAKRLLASMKGAAAPKEWQGGLGFEYRLESDGANEQGVRVKLRVEQERKVMHTANVVGMIRGTEYPEQKVIIGAHHDAWNHGAADPLCGTIAVVEAARVFGELAAQGLRPKRTLVFAGWTGEEFGLIGSTEWVEGREAELFKGGVAYINLDMASMGTQFGASASPSMHAAILKAAMQVPQAGNPSRTVYEDWTSRSQPATGAAWRPMPGNIGGGSDHVGFLCRAGVACAGFGSGGSSGWSYHSAYDTLPWYWKVVGADYESAMMVARMAAATAAEFAFEAEPVTSPEAYAHVGIGTLVRSEKAATEAGLDASRLESLRIELLELAFAAKARADRGEMNLATSMAVDRAWIIDRGGLERREWYKNVFAAPDENSGYDAWVFPMIQAAIERKDQAEFDRACDRTLARITAAVQACR